MKLKFKKTDVAAVTPVRSTVGSAAFDLFATSISIESQFIEINTNIAVEIPEGYFGMLVPRSSVTKKDLMLKNSVGIIDSDYRGDVKARFIRTPWRNFDENDQDAQFDIQEYAVGEKCVQLIILPCPVIELEEVDSLGDTNRGEGGFGSTGK
jgi:dUTP pyrophosphatase